MGVVLDKNECYQNASIDEINEGKLNICIEFVYMLLLSVL